MPQNKTPNTAPEDYSKSKLAVWGQITATLAIGLAGILFTITNSSEQEKNRKNIMATQIMSDREKSETDFRQSMFRPLIEQVLNDKLSLENRFNVFQIFQSNFSDLFNSRPMYDILWKKAKQEIDSNKNVDADRDIIKRLISLARMTNEKQEGLIGAHPKEKSEKKLARHDTLCWTYTEKDGDGDEEGKEEIKIIVDSITADGIKIRMTASFFDLKEKDTSVIVANNGRPFGVSYFDSPFTDNTLMPDGDRIAVILEDLNPDDKPDSATIRIIHFPADFVTVGYRPSINKLNELIGNKK